MNRQILRGVGIQGIQITINCADMHEAEQMFKEITKVQKSREFVKEFEKTPYDKRKEAFPDGRPAPIELSDEHLKKIACLFGKLFVGITASTLFDEDDNTYEEDI